MTDAIKLTVYLVGVAISLIYYNKKISHLMPKDRPFLDFILALCFSTVTGFIIMKLFEFISKLLIFCRII